MFECESSYIFCVRISIDSQKIIAEREICKSFFKLPVSQFKIIVKQSPSFLASKTQKLCSVRSYKISNMYCQYTFANPSVTSKNSYAWCLP
ncbi:hypothetical protein A0257_22235 [Hymenobacter psoromatis]|nr:hypothetical protein A0257_22235 [Hymenobacter psoromatis]